MAVSVLIISFVLFFCCVIKTSFNEGPWFNYREFGYNSACNAFHCAIAIMSLLFWFCIFFNRVVFSSSKYNWLFFNVSLNVEILYYTNIFYFCCFFCCFFVKFALFSIFFSHCELLCNSACSRKESFNYSY